MAAIRRAVLLLVLSTAPAMSQLSVTVVDSANVAILGARVELWSGTTPITVRTTDPAGIATFTAAESPRATDVLVRHIGFAPRRLRVVPDAPSVVVRIERLTQSLPAVTVAAVARSCPQSDEPEARALLRRVASRYREPSLEGRTTTLEQRQGAVDERDVGFFYDAEPRTGSRAYTAAGVLGGHRRLEEQGYVYPLDSTHTLELFGGWRYPAIEAELAGHFATERFAESHTFAVVSRTPSTVTLRFCAGDRRASGLDGTLQLSEDEGFVEARWRFWNPRDGIEQAGGATTFASAVADATPAPLTSTSGLFWRKLPSGRFIQRWQRFHDWRLVVDAPGADGGVLNDCAPTPNYVLCSAIAEVGGGGTRLTMCNSMPYRCFDD